MRQNLIKFTVNLARVSEAIAGCLLVAVILMNLAQVYFRYLLVDPISWTEETMRYSTTWMVMLAASPAFLRREHMEINLFDGVESPLIRRGVNLIMRVCVAGFCLLLIWQGFPAAIDNMRQVSPAVRIPMTIPYLAIPVGATLILINTVAMMLLPEDAFSGEEDMEGAP